MTQGNEQSPSPSVSPSGQPLQLPAKAGGKDDGGKVSPSVSGRRPTVKQRKFIKEYIDNGGNGTRAALAAYDTDDNNTAHAIASENLRKPTIHNAIKNALARQGIDESTLAAIHGELLDSKSERIRHDALKMAYDVLGANAPKRSESVRVNASLEDLIDAQNKRSNKKPKQSDNIPNGT